jgi:hypothetical protein
MAKTNTVRRESRRKGSKNIYEYVVRDINGRFIARLAVKGSGINLATAKKIYDKNKTLTKSKDGKEWVSRSKQSFTNVNSYTNTVSSSYKDRKGKLLIDRPIATVVQYQVSGIYKGTLYRRHSDKLSGERSRFARDQAWERFLELISSLGTNRQISDESEGLKYIDEVTDIREGWVYYKAKSSKGKRK